MVEPRNVAQAITGKLQDTLGDALQSVVLHGSVARGESIAGLSDVNLLIRVDVLDPRRMAQVAPLIQDWVRKGNSPPNIFTEKEWKGVGDTFAIEIADMKDAREVIHGEDPIAPKELSPSDLRLHAEREIRETMQQLRLRMFLSAADARRLGSILLAGMPSFSAYMRSALRLVGEQPPARTEEVIERAADLVDVDAEPLLRCQKARREIRPPEVRMAGSTVEGYLHFLDRLMLFIDTLPSEPAGTLSGTAPPPS